MGRSLTLLAVALVSVGVVACGGAVKNAHLAHRPSSSAATSGTPALAAAGTSKAPVLFKGDGDDDGVSAIEKERSKFDRDGDADNEDGGGYYDIDDDNLLFYGHTASAADGRAIRAVVRRYYATAAADNGAAACPLLSSALAREAPREYGQSPGSRVPRGETCATALSRLFRQLHRLVAGGGAPLKLGVIRVQGSHGLAWLGVRGTLSDSYIEVRRQDGAWKIDSLFDRELP